MKRTNIHTIAIVVFVAILLGVGGYLAYKKQNVAETKTYTNSTYGVAFDYSDDYELTETPLTDTASGTGIMVTLIEKGTKIPENGEGPRAITVGMYENATATGSRSEAEQWIDTSPYSNFKLSTMPKPGTSRIAEQEALLYTWEGLYPGTTVVTEHNGNIIAFSVTYDGNTDMKILQDFTSLVESVQLLDPVSATTTPTGTSSQE